MPTLASTFESNEPLLSELLEKIAKGRTQLPDFQRGWVWDDEHIRSLLASVSLAYPIGAVMLLETGGEGGRFLPRLFEGVRLQSPPDPEILVLDGQQRLTSLFLTLKSGQAVPTRTEKGDEISRIYYIDIRASLDPEAERLEAIRSIPADRQLRSDFGRRIDLDLSTAEREFELCMYPLAAVFDAAANQAWETGFFSYHDYDRDMIRLFQQFREQVWMVFQQYKIPTIELQRTTPKEAVCQVFEKVNTGGEPLTVFELVTATFAADDFRLRQDWQARQARLRERRVLRSFDATAFLTAVTLLSSYERNQQDGRAVSCKRRDVLRLPLSEYQIRAPFIEQALLRAAQFLAGEKVFDERTLPYGTQLIPLSVIFAILGNQAEEARNRQKIAQWYWSGVFGEQYGGANETRYALDVVDVPLWVADDEAVPRTIRDASFSPIRLLSLQTRQSAAYKGLMSLLMKHGSKDFVTGQKIEISDYFDLAMDVHHVFPRNYSERQGFPARKWNSAVNKSPLSARTNRMLGGVAPSQYTRTIERAHAGNAAAVDAIYESHCLRSDLIREDRFDELIADRAKSLLELIEQAMGKEIQGRDSEEVVAAFGTVLTREVVA